MLWMKFCNFFCQKFQCYIPDRELAGIYPLLEVDDMVRFQKPDWKCVFTYVQSFYRRFRDGRSPPPRSGQARGEEAGPPVELKLSEVARAVAECQEAEDRGRRIVKQLSSEDKKTSQDLPGDAAAHQTEEKIVKQVSCEDKKSSLEDAAPEEAQERPTESEVSSELLVRAVEVSPPVTEEETPREVHTESVSITLQPSPSPSPGTRLTSSKMSRSKSVATDRPEAAEDGSVQERKLSFNQPRPSMSPPALQL